MYSDKVLTCVDCGSEFVFTASEQEFYAEKGFENEPKRCKECRDAKKAQRRSNGGNRRRPQRRMFSAVCADCGQETSVPFKPSDDRPVYCKDCYQARNPR